MIQGEGGLFGSGALKIEFQDGQCTLAGSNGTVLRFGSREWQPFALDLLEKDHPQCLGSYRWKEPAVLVLAGWAVGTPFSMELMLRFDGAGLQVEGAPANLKVHLDFTAVPA